MYYVRNVENVKGPKKSQDVESVAKASTNSTETQFIIKRPITTAEYIYNIKYTDNKKYIAA